MFKRGNRNYLIIALFLVVISLGVGYALFAESLTITGTASTTGTFDVEFYQASVQSSAFISAPTATISTDKNTLTLTASDLERPEAYVTYAVQIRNTGSIDAELLGVTITGDTNEDLTVDTTTFVPGTVLASGATYDFTVTVEWPLSSETGAQSINYSVEIDYQQDQ